MNVVIDAAWRARENAHLVPPGKTKVGCAVRADGYVFSGCNVQTPWRADVHAEVVALTAMVAAGVSDPDVVVITAERDFFTPCGACRDLIVQLAPNASVVAANRSGVVWEGVAADLLPDHPR